VTQCSYERGEGGSYRLQGPLVFDSVPDLYAGLVGKLRESGDLTIDLSGVTRADSAGMALLVEWQRLARAEGGKVKLVNMPPQVVRMVRVTGLEELLGTS
jgi:phospholipid transport system transporter-binding protein